MGYNGGTYFYSCWRIYGCWCNDMLAVGRSDEEVTIDIPSNASFNYISDILYKNNIINNKSFFNLYATMTKSKSGFIKGTYDIKKILIIRQLFHIFKQILTEQI